MVIKNSVCGNFCITKDKTNKTCSGFVFTIHDKESCGTLYPFYETGTLAKMEYYANEMEIFFK